MNNYSGSSYLLTDISGKVIVKGNCNELNNIDISDKANGVYVIQIRYQQNELIDTRKLIKK